MSTGQTGGDALTNFLFTAWDMLATRRAHSDIMCHSGGVAP
jgi:hypothetical protein